MERSEGPRRARSIPPNDPALASVRHELGTPLHQIVGFAELLLMDGSAQMTDDTREALEAIARSARRLRAVFHEIVELAEAAGGQADVRGSTRAGELVAAVAATLRERGASFELALADANDVHVSAPVPSVSAVALATLAMQLARMFPRATVHLGCQAQGERVTLRAEARADALDSSLLAGLLDHALPPSRRRGLDLASRLRMTLVQALLAAHAASLDTQAQTARAAFVVGFDAAKRRAGLPMVEPGLETLRMRFLAAVGHDLRSPLNAIQGFADLLLLDASLAAPVRESLTIVQRAAQELLVRIDRMVAWARTRAQQLDA